ncbi:zf-CCHC domain-containing protein [Cephalotus follicularis]|uniref:Zf-CCHC domain-containing protein n=1 Tax=Cephalotus follicularis TaxID=3775 RepID=A0A1Q3CHY3_CEPFO|nr:zf-CCHC domain-containing protein [Cephalotus follicularis]
MKEELICYECKKSCHFKSDCPSIKKKGNEHSKKKKAMIATWDDSDESSPDEESDGEVANTDFLAIEEEEDDEVNFSFYDLQNAYENLFCEYEMCEENENLKLEIDALKKTFSKFLNCSENLDNLLGLQRCVFDKAGLGYEEMKNVKHLNDFFIKKNEPKITCNYCGRLGHISTSCLLKKIYCGSLGHTSYSRKCTDHAVTGRTQGKVN